MSYSGVIVSLDCSRFRRNESIVERRESEEELSVDPMKKLAVSEHLASQEPEEDEEAAEAVVVN